MCTQLSVDISGLVSNWPAVFNLIGWSQIQLNLEKEVETVFSEHLSSIPGVYYLIGMERLKGLKAWTQGRAEGAPIENHPEIPDGI